jgi:hypothetical protein
MRIKEDPGSPGTPKHLKGSCQDPGRSQSLSREVTPRPSGSFDPSGRDPAGQKCAWNRRRAMVLPALLSGWLHEGPGDRAPR